MWGWVPEGTLGPGPALRSDPGQGPDISTPTFLTNDLGAGTPAPASPREAFQGMTGQGPGQGRLY